jgi:hypothetical protein
MQLRLNVHYMNRQVTLKDVYGMKLKFLQTKITKVFVSSVAHMHNSVTTTTRNED